MIGISLCGSYLPIFRIDRDSIAATWERTSIGGQKSVANNDEDAITLAVEASRNCIGDWERNTIDGVFFATTSAPYIEKMNATLIATALDLKREITTLDFCNSLRAGTGALKVAFDSVKSGSLNSILVAASDCRMGYPRSDEEQTFGDASAALMVSKHNTIANLEGSYSISNEMMDVWRNSEDTFVRTWETRFILGKGYTDHIKEVISGILKKYSLTPTEITKVILPATNIRVYSNVLKSLGFDKETQGQDPLISSVGYSGTTHPLLMLVGALENASPGDILLLTSYADGADAMIFRVTGDIKKIQNQNSIKHYLNNNIKLKSYARFMSYKGLIETVPGEPFRLMPSATASWRDRNSILRCRGSRCKECGVLTFPIQRVCYSCDAKDRYKEEPISHFKGEVYTFTRDKLAGRSDDPVVVQTIAEMGPDKVRFYGMMTDCKPSDVKIGMPVELTFRRIYDGAGMHNYFWKCKPVNERRND